MALDVVRTIPTAVRRGIHPAGLVRREFTILPTALVSIPFGAVIALQWAA